MSENGKEKLGLEKILCPECKEWSLGEEWREFYELPCDQCGGDHDGLICPKCGEAFDQEVFWGFDRIEESSNNTPKP